MRYTPQRVPVTSMSIATERTYRDDEGKEHKDTEWHSVLAWRALAEACNQYLNKGKLVYIEGRLHSRDWEDENKVKQRRTEVIAEQVKFLEPKKGAPAGATEEADLPL